MIRFTLLFCCLTGFGLSPASAQVLETSSLPELVIVGDINATPATWFRSDSNLYHLATCADIHFHVMSAESKLYKDRYEKIIAGTPPLLLFQKAGGGVVYAASAHTMPSSPSELYSALKKSWEQAEAAKPLEAELISSDCPDGFCPNQPHEPDPSPRLRPMNRVPSAAPMVGNWFTDSISTGMILVGVTVVVILMILFGLVFLAFFLLLGQFLPRR